MSLSSWEHLVRPYKVAFERQSDVSYKESIVVEPLEKGFGVTLGNALRRVLLSSIQGSAVTSVRIEGTVLEFSHLPGITEDVTDIILNLKTLALRLHGESHQRFKISAKGPGVVTAGDIQRSPQLTVLNPDQVICTLSESGSFEAEICVDRGKGYVPASVSSDSRMVGEIMMDARFNPVRHVSYVVDHTRVAQSTDYDRLVLSVETNGAVTPKEAIAEAARILQDQLKSFVSFDARADVPVLPHVVAQDMMNAPMPGILFRLVKELELSVRCLNCLKIANIVYLGDLVTRSEADLMGTPNFGRKSLDEIKTVLATWGLKLGMCFPDWPPENMDQYMSRGIS